MPEEEFYGVLKICDAFDLVRLEASFVEEARTALAVHPLLTPADLERLGTGVPEADIAAQFGASMPAQVSADGTVPSMMQPRSATRIDATGLKCISVWYGCGTKLIG